MPFLPKNTTTLTFTQKYIFSGWRFVFWEKKLFTCCERYVILGKMRCKEPFNFPSGSNDSPTRFSAQGGTLFCLASPILACLSSHLVTFCVYQINHLLAVPDQVVPPKTSKLSQKILNQWNVNRELSVGIRLAITCFVIGWFQASEIKYKICYSTKTDTLVENQIQYSNRML